IVMSDSEDSTITYTAVSSPFGGLSDIGSPGVDGPPVMPEDPYAYVVAAFQAPPSPDYDPEKDPIDYPADGGDNDDESSDDDEDDGDDVKKDEDEEEEEEHLAPTDSVPPPVHRVTARMSIREQPPTPFWSEAEIDRLLAIPSPPPSPLSPWSSPDHRAERLEVFLPPWKRLCIALGPRYKINESSSAPTVRPT
ncbi:hypothetical protein Tco_1573832, partial [Tanacetum coccineum]